MRHYEHSEESKIFHHYNGLFAMLIMTVVGEENSVLIATQFN